MDQINQERKEPNIEATNIVKRLSSWRASERQKATQTLQQMGPHAVEALLTLLESENRERKRSIRIRNVFFITFAIYIASSLIAFLVYVMPNIPRWHQVVFHVDPIDLIGYLILFSILPALSIASKRQKRAATILAQFDDLRTIGPLVEALEFFDKDTRSVVEAALVRIVPRLQATDVQLLNKIQYKRLYRLLKSKNANLVLAILKAIEQIGDRHAKSYVEKLARGEEAAAKNPRVRAAAQACLLSLQEQQAKEDAMRTLLRPTTVPDAPAEVLVRPASPLEGDLLLRPSISEEEK